LKRPKGAGVKGILAEQDLGPHKLIISLGRAAIRCDKIGGNLMKINTRRRLHFQ
jgi:hypothetical protein